MRLNLYFWLGGTTSVFLVLLVLVLIRPGQLPADDAIARAIPTAFGVVFDPASSIAQLALLFAPPIAVLLFVLYKRHWSVALWFVAAVVSSILVSGTLQLVVGRPGPPPRAVLEPQTSGSFPSVSVEEAVVQVVLICYLAWRFSWTWRRSILALAIADVVLISVLLIDIGVHWPSDVLGGLCFGGAWAVIALITATRWRRLRESFAAAV